MNRSVRTLITTLAAFAFALVWAGIASAASVTVNFPRDGGSKTVDLGSLGGSFDVNHDYTLVGASGQTTTKQISGISLRALLEAVGADPTYSAVTLARPGGGVVRISRTQIEAGGVVPVIYADGGLATFVRPSYSATDQNALDVISAPTLTISQVDGTDYDLKAKVSKSSAKIGESLKFTASATGAAGQKLIFTWNFNDGSTADGDIATHRFKKRGYYRVLVTVRGEGESASVSTVLRVQVGRAVKSKKQREGGGTNDAAGAPVSGQADGGNGSGQTAAPATHAARRQHSKPAHKRRSKQEQPSGAGLERVTGELLTAPEQKPATSSLAARSGQQVKPAQNQSNGIPPAAASALAALGLLAFGAALEMGAAGRLRHRLLSS